MWSKDKPSALGRYSETSKEVPVLAVGGVEVRLDGVPVVPVER
jgi:hypothetical protein